MYKIAHLSDLHISYADEKGRGRNLVELLEDIRKRGADHLCVTGDIADNPVKEDLVYSREIFAQYDFSESENLSLVPGNHDIYGSAPPGELSYTFPKICRDTDTAANTEQFLSVFESSFGEERCFPFLKNAGGVSLIGINSITSWSAKKNPEGSNGKLDKEETEALENILNSGEASGKVRIALVHHYFNSPGDVKDLPAHSIWLDAVDWKMKFHKPRKFLKLLSKGRVNIVLHGHSHWSGVYVKDGISFVNSSACSIPLTDDRQRKYHMLMIPDKLKTESVTIETVVMK